MTDEQRNAIIRLIKTGSETNMEFAKNLAMSLGDAEFVVEVTDKIAMMRFANAMAKLAEASAISAQAMSAASAKLSTIGGKVMQQSTQDEHLVDIDKINQSGLSAKHARPMSEIEQKQLRELIEVLKKPPIKP